MDVVGAILPTINVVHSLCVESGSRHLNQQLEVEQVQAACGSYPNSSDFLDSSGGVQRSGLHQYIDYS